MTNKQRLGWIGASIAAGIFPTFQMTFASQTLAPPPASEHENADQDKAQALDTLADWSGQSTHFTSGERTLRHAGRRSFQSNGARS